MSRCRSRRGPPAPIGLALAAALCAAGSARAGGGRTDEIGAWTLAQRPRPFVAAGSPRNALLQAQDGPATTFFTPGGFTTALPGGGWAIRWSVAGAAAAPVPEGPLPGKLHFLTGSGPRRWRTHVPTFARVRYPALAPGLEGTIEPASGGLRWSLRGDLRALARTWLRYEGVQAAAVSADGRTLALRTGQGTLTETLPPGARYARLRAGDAAGTFEYRIDPGDQAAAPGTFTAGLAWSGYLAGRQLHSDTINELSIAPDGAIVAVGETSSPDYPVTPGKLRTTLGGPQDAHVTRVSPEGTLIWATYLGGANSSENGEGVLVEPGGQILVIGRTRSSDFPTTALAFDTTFNGPTSPTLGGDAFIAKLAADGASLVWSTFLGGRGEDYGLALARGTQGEVYAGGWTGSDNFPQLSPIDTTFGGSTCPSICDAWVAGLTADGRTLMFSSWYGGSAHDTVEDLAVDSAHTLYVVGTTSSIDLPLSSTRFDSTLDGPYDGYLLKVVTSPLPALSYATYLGGIGPDSASSVWIDATGGMVVTGATSSPDFPVVAGLGRPYAGNGDAFVLRLPSSGTPLTWSSLIGGSLLDELRNVALGPLGTIHLAGRTASPDFPVTRAFENAFRGGAGDGWVARLSPNGSVLDFASYVGGSGDDDARCVEVDGRGNVYVGGSTTSPDFPRTVLQDAGQAKDGFLLKIDTTPPDAGVVRDGPGVDLSVQENTGTLSANWAGFSDPDSPVVAYEWALGTGAGQADLLPFTDAGTSTSATATGLGLLVGTTYFATVRAYNGAGARVEASSDGVRIVLPPGASCSSPGQCPAFCTSGVCCAVSACPQCQACQAGTGVCGPGPDDAGCSNGLFCDGMESCRAGACVSGTAVACLETDAGEKTVCDESVPGCVPIPTAPTILSRPPATGLVGRAYVHTLVVAGSRPFTFGFCQVPPAGMTLDAAGTLQWTPLQVGAVAVCVEARNTAGVDRLTFNVDVTMRPVQPDEVTLQWTVPPEPYALGATQQITLHARNILGVEVSGVRAALEPSGLELSERDGGPAWPCDSAVRRDLPPLPAGGQVDLPLTARFCSRGDGGVRLVARLEDADGGRPLTPDLVHEFKVEASFTTTACGCSGGPGGLLSALAALSLALALRLNRRA